MMGPTEEHSTIWKGIALRISWAPQWFERPCVDCAVAHLEVRSETGEPLPISQTGYRSHFLSREAVDAHGGPIQYVVAWLNHDAANHNWRKAVEKTTQLSLF